MSCKYPNHWHKIIRRNKICQWQNDLRGNTWPCWNYGSSILRTRIMKISGFSSIKVAGSFFAAQVTFSQLCCAQRLGTHAVAKILNHAAIAAVTLSWQHNLIKVVVTDTANAYINRCSGRKNGILATGVCRRGCLKKAAGSIIVQNLAEMGWFSELES